MKHNFIDLHCHSKFSDGDKNIEQLIELFRYTNTKFVSITDHDDLRSIKKLLKLNVQDITFIPGVELSTVYYGKNRKDYYIHVLGYGINHDFEPLKQEMLKFRQNRYENNIQLLKKIEKSGIVVPQCIYEQVRLENYNSIVTEFKKCLIKNNFDNEFIASFITSAKKFLPQYDGYEMGVFKAIKLIREAGGVPVLAHPQKIKFTEEQLFHFVKKAKNEGLMGIEVFYSEFDHSTISYNKSLAEYFGLLQSVGSDFHVIDEDNKLPGLGINYNLCKTKCSLLDYLLDHKLVLNSNLIKTQEQKEESCIQEK